MARLEVPSTLPGIDGRPPRTVKPRLGDPVLPEVELVVEALQPLVDVMQDASAWPLGLLWAPLWWRLHDNFHVVVLGLGLLPANLKRGSCGCLYTTVHILVISELRGGGVQKSGAKSGALCRPQTDCHTPTVTRSLT